MAIKFTKRKELESGAFGVVWLVTDDGLGVDRALKVISLAGCASPDETLTEARIMAQLSHPNIVKVHEVGMLDADRLYICMDYEPGGSVADRLGDSWLPITQAVALACDSLRGLAHAHQNGVTHGDIKPANILIGARAEGKLSDFGLARGMGMVPPADKVYLTHAAPEVFNGVDPDDLTDVYAAGVTLYRMLNGRCCPSRLVVPMGA